MLRYVVCPRYAKSQTWQLKILMPVSRYLSSVLDSLAGRLSGFKQTKLITSLSLCQLCETLGRHHWLHRLEPCVCVIYCLDSWRK